VGLTQRSALSAPKGVGKGRGVVRGEEPTPLEGREAAKGLVEDAQGPGSLLACCGHIVVCRAEACLAAHCICLAKWILRSGWSG